MSWDHGRGWNITSVSLSLIFSPNTYVDFEKWVIDLYLPRWLCIVKTVLPANMRYWAITFLVILVGLDWLTFNRFGFYILCTYTILWISEGIRESQNARTQLCFTQFSTTVSLESSILKLTETFINECKVNLSWKKCSGYRSFRKILHSFCLFHEFKACKKSTNTMYRGIFSSKHFFCVCGKKIMFPRFEQN